MGGLNAKAGVTVPSIFNWTVGCAGSLVSIGARLRYLPFDFPVFQVSVTCAVSPGGIVFRETLLTVHLHEGFPGTIFSSDNPSLRSRNVWDPV